MKQTFNDISKLFGSTMNNVIKTGLGSLSGKKSITKSVFRNPIFYVKLLLVLLCFYFIYKLYTTSLYNEAYYVKQGRENFQNNNEQKDKNMREKQTNNETFSLNQTEKYVEKKGINLYDDFYVDFYDDIVYDNQKNSFELENLNKIMGLDDNSMKQNASILDVGSGTGHHIYLYHKNGYTVQGLEKSQSMITRSNENYPGVDVKLGDATDTYLYEEGDFTHIQCLYFTVYYMKNKKQFFDNCYRWLKPGGYFAIHLVDRVNFDPIVNTANPLFLVSPQKYAKERITSSIIQFKGISYKANFDLQKDKDISKFTETFKDDKTGKIRKNIHEFYMPNHMNIVKMIQESGFTLKAKLDMVKCQYEYQYIYVFYKQ